MNVIFRPSGASRATTVTKRKKKILEKVYMRRSLIICDSGWWDHVNTSLLVFFSLSLYLFIYISLYICLSIFIHLPLVVLLVSVKSLWYHLATFNYTCVFPTLLLFFLLLLLSDFFFLYFNLFTSLDLIFYLYVCLSLLPISEFIFFCFFAYSIHCLSVCSCFCMSSLSAPPSLYPNPRTDLNTHT